MCTQTTKQEESCLKACADKMFHIQARCMQRWQTQIQLQQNRQMDFMQMQAQIEQEKAATSEGETTK